MVRTRFAPSPTGSLHLGNARTAALNWLYARQQGGAFILRFEDTDLERGVEGAERDIQDALEWLDKLAPPSWKPRSNETAEQLLPDPGDYRHHAGGEDNGDAHLKRQVMGREVHEIERP